MSLAPGTSFVQTKVNFVGAPHSLFRVGSSPGLSGSSLNTTHWSRPRTHLRRVLVSSSRVVTLVPSTTLCPDLEQFFLLTHLFQKLTFTGQHKEKILVPKQFQKGWNDICFTHLTPSYQCGSTQVLTGLDTKGRPVRGVPGPEPVEGGKWPLVSESPKSCRAETTETLSSPLVRLVSALITKDS